MTEPPGRARAAVFDLDGTLVDTMRTMPQAYADTIRELGGPALTPADVVADWHIGPAPVLLSHFLRRPVRDADVDRYQRRADAAAAAARPFAGVPDMLDALSAAGYRLGLYTSATRRVTTGVLAAAGLAGRFPVVVCGDEVGSPKPAPDGLLDSCRHLGVGPGETAYVGDAATDLHCARAAGALAVHATWGVGATPRPPGRHLTASSPAQLARLLGASRPAGWS